MASTSETESLATPSTSSSENVENDNDLSEVSSGISLEREGQSIVEDVNSQPTSCKLRKIDTVQKLCQDTVLDHDVNQLASRQPLNEGSALKDDEIRWLTVGVCLHKIISPALRKYIPQIMQCLYGNLKVSDSIDTQTFTSYLRRYIPTNKELNYEAINSNFTVPKMRGRPDIRSYVYGVKDEVDLSKLFLPTHMTHYTGFDDTCDSSALLSIIIYVDTFPASLRSVAETVRNDIRNEWAHCNFSVWDTLKLQNSFMLMKHLIGCLNLPAQEGRDILQEIDRWENNGLNILHSTVGFSVLEELKKETTSLANYCQSKSSTSDDNLAKVLLSLKDISSKFEGIENRLSVVEKKIDDLSETSDPSKRGHHFTAPSRAEIFVGREIELQKLNENFNVSNENPCIQAISGLGGMGKTSLANEYSWKYREQYPGGVFWVSIESDNTLLDSFQQLSVHAGLQYRDAKQAMRKFLQWMSTRKEKWLFVADNLDSDELTDTMKEFLFGFWKRDTKGHVIITTRREGRNAKESLKVNYCINLDKLTRTQSIYFLKARTDPTSDKDEKALDALVKELDGLPLALEQVAAYVKCVGCTFKEYWNEFKRVNLSLLKPIDNKSHMKMSKERLTVQTTWDMNFDYIKRQSEKEGLGTAAVTVMEMFALLPADCIYLEVLNANEIHVSREGRNPVKEEDKFKYDLYDVLSSELKKKQVIEILCRFSVIKVNKENTAIMHHLVQMIIQENMTESHIHNLRNHLQKMVNGAMKKVKERFKIEASNNLIHDMMLFLTFNVLNSMLKIQT